MTKIGKLSFVSFVFIIFVSSVFGTVGKRNGKITGEVNLNIKQEKISAKLKYDYIAGKESESEIKFYLNESFNVSKIKCGICRAFAFDLKAERHPTLKISLKRALQKGERLPIEIEYDGSLKDMLYKEHNFLEFGLDWFWYPVRTDIGQFDFLYRLIIKTDVPDYQLAGNGRVTRKGRNWLIESKVADWDIDLVLSDKLKFTRYDQDGYNLQIVSNNLTAEAPAVLLGNIKETLDFYNSTFGASNRQTEITAVIRPIPENPDQGGYFRKGYFILQKPDNVEDLFGQVAHELAHYWWLNADQQNAWLNESFAEYSSLLAIRRLKSAEAFNKNLEQKKKLNVGLPPIYEFDRTKNRQQSPRVLYVKGSLKLNELENELGEKKFLEFLKKAADAKIDKTDKLIELLAAFSSRETADRFLAKLKE